MTSLCLLITATLLAAPTLVTASIHRPPEDEIIYFIMPDRFLDGDPTNNFGGDERQGFAREDVMRHGYLPTHKGYYHGGDLRGVMMALPYLQDLGVTAIWLAPIFKNQTVQPDRSSLYGHSAAYHGYWILNFLQVDPHLGTNDEFRELVSQAHARDMKVYLDIVTNHTADVIRLRPWPQRNYERRGGYVSKSLMPYRDGQGEPFDDAAVAYDGRTQRPFPRMTDEGFPYQPIVLPEDRDAKHPAWLNEPQYYHNRGDSRFADESSLYGDFFGLDDLFTERPEVVQGMIAIYRHWIEAYHVDGFRIDTTRHVNVEFWQAFAPAMWKAAKEKGIEHFIAFGEVADRRPEVLSYFTTEGKLQSVLDFGFQKAARSFASRSGSADQLRALFESDDYYTDADSDVYSLPTFLGNHDMGRFGRFLLQDNPDASDEEIVARSILAHALMFFARGTPVIYYGDEQGFTGDGGDKDAREDMFASQVAVYNDNRLIGTHRSTAELNFDPSHPLYRALQRLAKVYRKHAGLRRGAQFHRFSSEGPGLYAFSRIDAKDKVEYVVAFNNSGGGRSTEALVPTFCPGGAFDLIFSQPLRPMETVEADEKGRLPLRLEPFGVAVYRAVGSLKASEELPKLVIVTPVAGETLIASQRY
ncbi:MAG: alpha-amylase, partial [Planctomycetes bacterium]|nr:alpha-amylase [Planctomycetota bacterium]